MNPIQLHQDHPQDFSPEQRCHAIAQILALGIARLRVPAALADTPEAVDFAAHRSVHTHSQQPTEKV